jgi:hypothetical protein
MYFHRVLPGPAPMIATFGGGEGGGGEGEEEATMVPL